MTYFNELKNHVLISKKVTDRLFYPSIKRNQSYFLFSDWSYSFYYIYSFFSNICQYPG